MDTRMEYVTAQEAARILGYDDSHIRRLCGQGILEGKKWANSWMISLDSVMAHRYVRIKERRGRPRSG